MCKCLNRNENNFIAKKCIVIHGDTIRALPMQSDPISSINHNRHRGDHNIP